MIIFLLIENYIISMFINTNIFLLLHIITEFVLLKTYDKFIITKIKPFKFKP